MYPGTPLNLGKRTLSTVTNTIRINGNERTPSALLGMGFTENSDTSPVGQLPLSVVFDDLMRHYDHHTNYGCENEFQEFISNQENCRKQWLDAELECIRHQTEIGNLQAEQQRSEIKMQDVRRQLESKMESLVRLESDNERMRNRMSSAMTLCKSYLNDLRVGAEAKDKVSSILAVLEGVEYKRNQSHHHGHGQNVRSPGNGLDTISEADTTDLSMTYSEDGLDASVSRRTRNKRRSAGKRSSIDMHESFATREAGSAKKLRTSNGSKQMVELSGSAQQVISHTVVSIPHNGGRAHAISTLETVNANQASTFASSDSRILRNTVQPAIPSTSESDSDWQPLPPPVKPHYQTRASLTKQQQQQSFSESPRFGRTLSTAGGSMRPHGFATKTVLKPEICEPCGKRIKFSKTALKCVECKATCHPECKDLVPLPCVNSSTPGNNKRHMGLIADYVPSTHPMVPALIQHCVNEVEVRGLNTVGLYRVPGPEKEVKDLKERFLRGKGVPNLGRYDIHAICGCIKDFLRSLQEPLVGRWFWRDFAAATEISDPIVRQSEINRILEELPPPNQDTLAFVILHLQRIAELPEIKMPIGNLSKVFGPTIVGYSQADIDASTMLKETKKQQMIVETLLSMSPDFWKRYIFRASQNTTGQEMNGRSSRSRASAGQTPMQTPSKSASKSSMAGKTRKKITYFDDSPKEVHFASEKRTYFD